MRGRHHCTDGPVLSQCFFQCFFGVVPVFLWTHRPSCSHYPPLPDHQSPPLPNHHLPLPTTYHFTINIPPPPFHYHSPLHYQHSPPPFHYHAPLHYQHSPPPEYQLPPLICCFPFFNCRQQRTDGTSWALALWSPEEGPTPTEEGPTPTVWRVATPWVGATEWRDSASWSQHPLEHAPFCWQLATIWRVATLWVGATEWRHSASGSRHPFGARAVLLATGLSFRATASSGARAVPLATGLSFRFAASSEAPAVPLVLGHWASE